jgi:hypothetical protein
MVTKNKLPFDESDNGKYIIVKIPRKNVQGDVNDPSILFSNRQIYRHSLRTIGYIVILLTGIIIGSIFHDRILSIHSNHATWKIFTTTVK